jgi:hypothetical protein
MFELPGVSGLTDVCEYGATEEFGVEVDGGLGLEADTSPGTCSGVFQKTTAAIKPPKRRL